jgi:hypothetical protein
LLGVCAGFFLYAQLAPLTWAWTAIPTATAGAGLAAMIWGDAFWERVAPWLIGW